MVACHLDRRLTPRVDPSDVVQEALADAARKPDEYLKNPKGFLGLTPLQSVTGWHLQHEQDAEKGLTMYFTPIKAGSNERTLPIGVKWNPATKRYQSLDMHYETFLTESPSLQSPRSTLR